MNWLDRTIGFFAPSRGLERAQARAAMTALLSYEGARAGRRTDGWITSGSSADSEVGLALTTMRERARDLVRNNPHAAKGLSVIVSNKIGTGIMIQAAGPNARLNKRIDERWKRWIDECDVQGKHDLYGLQSLAERTRAESGEALIRFIPTPARGRDDIAFRLQVLEPDFLDHTRHQQVDETTEIRHGIEYRNGVPVAYYLFDRHPGDSGFLGRSMQSQRVPAAEVIHLFKSLRAGQSRGMTDFAPVMLRLRAIDDYADAELMRKKIAACLAAFVTTPGGLPASSIGPTRVEGTDRYESVHPGMIGYLKPGESVTFSDPKPSGDYREFLSEELHAVAAGLNMPFELLTGNLSEVTYTSHRGGLVQFRGMVEADQWQLIVPQLCRPIWKRFVAEAALLDGTLPRDVPATYTPPRFGLLDPAKEVPAMIEAIQGGVMTWPNTVRREGYDPMEQLEEIERWQKELDRRGIVLTSDARTQQKTAEPAPTPAPKPSDDVDDHAAAAA